MNSLRKSKITALAAMAVIVVMLFLTFPMRPSWWYVSDIFLAFMMAFAHLMSITLEGMSPAASRKLEYVAAALGFLTVIAMIVEYITLQ